MRFGWRSAPHRLTCPGQEFEGGLPARCKDLAGRQEPGHGGGSTGGSEWQEELRQRAGREALQCAQRPRLSPPLLAAWTYECAARLTTINSPGGERVRAPRGAQDPRHLYAGPQRAAGVRCHRTAARSRLLSLGAVLPPRRDARSHAPLRLRPGASGR